MWLYRPLIQLVQVLPILARGCERHVHTVRKSYPSVAAGYVQKVQLLQGNKKAAPPSWVDSGPPVLTIDINATSGTLILYLHTARPPGCCT